MRLVEHFDVMDTGHLLLLVFWELSLLHVFFDELVPLFDRFAFVVSLILTARVQATVCLRVEQLTVDLKLLSKQLQLFLYDFLVAEKATLEVTVGVGLSSAKRLQPAINSISFTSFWLRPHI